MLDKIKIFRGTIFFCIAIVANIYISDAQVLRKRVATLMGGRFEITIVDKDSLSAEHDIDTAINEISRIEYLISDWKPNTQVSEINRNAGVKPVKVDKELFELTKRAIELSQLTNGAFDISFAAMERIWKFDGSMTTMPDSTVVKKAVANVGYKNIILDSVASTIFLRLPGMKIGFGALGEGYAADRCRTMMWAKGVNAGIVNATGDMSLWGTQPNGKAWKIGITNPMRKDKIYTTLSIKDGSVTTSGNYEKYALIDGRRYTHIINPATGYPTTGLCSVTVVGPSAEFSNGLSTSIMVLGRDNGWKLLQLFPEYRCIMVTDEGIVDASKSLQIKKRKL